MTRVRIKPGVLLHNPAVPAQTLSSIWGVALPVIDSVFGYYGFDTIITSGFDGEHNADSLHYKGQALDFRSYHVQPNAVSAERSGTIIRDQLLQSILMRLKESLGKDFDVILHRGPSPPEHFHIEYDPE